ncbi:MAG: hypothetical protein HS102_07775 [Planctomycetia bacterium]|nr:hypothetical protein [Planctomycetia bacterium]
MPFGLFSEYASATQASSVLFDDYKVWLCFPWEQHGRRWRSSALTAVSSGELNVQGKQFGGEAVFTGHMDGDFVAEVQVRLNSGKDAAIYFRYLDPDHWYRARLQGTPAGAILLEKMHKGKLTTLDSAAAFPSDPDVLRVKCVGSALEVWYNPAGTPGAATLSATDGDIGWGGVALSGWDALFDNLRVGYDADDDDDLDGSDDVVIDEDFSSTSVSPTHDDAGNLTKDADYAYVYDAWNNLVKVKAQNDADVVVGVYAYYADNRRASKVVTNRGDLDGTTYFFYDGLREIEERNGSEQVTQQYVWGHEYLDQLLMIRGAGGTWFVHQDANWNVIALTTPNGDVAEEVQYQPYGLPQVRRHLAFGDADADGDVDSADNTAHTAALSTYNRAFDADFDGDVSNTSGDADKEAWDASYNNPAASTTMVVVNRSFSPSGSPFLFTGRRLDAETGLYYYRFRTYHPTLKTFLQRDPLGYVDSASLYQYVGGSPLFWLDPFGLERILIIVANDAPQSAWKYANGLAARLRRRGNFVRIRMIDNIRAFERMWGNDTFDRIILLGHGDDRLPAISLGVRKGKRDFLDPTKLKNMRPGAHLFFFEIYSCYQGRLPIYAAWLWALWYLNIDVRAHSNWFFGTEWPALRDYWETYIDASANLPYGEGQGGTCLP